MVRKLIEEYKKWGLEVNIGKTKYMIIGGNSTALTTDAGIIQTCKDCKYLGVTIPAKGTSDRYIISKLAQAVRYLNPIIWDNKIRKDTAKNWLFFSVVNKFIFK